LAGKIITTIGKTALFEPQPSLEDSARLHPVFTSLDFVTIVLFKQSKVVSPASNPKLEDLFNTTNAHTGKAF
jgi:hypothetical protein